MKRITRVLATTTLGAAVALGGGLAIASPAEAAASCGPGYKQISKKPLKRGKTVVGDMYVYGYKYAKGKYKTKHWHWTCAIAKPRKAYKGKVSHIQVEMFRMNNVGSITGYVEDGRKRNYKSYAGPIRLKTYGYAQSAVVKNAKLKYKGKWYSS
ncbi:hypothetical protein [Actinomadura rudentiformis]|uniref:Uncharacterized protein n=1 Tax=Actinomadura rudentiformis TaxID=359158 RepID=A0A6H9YVR3_9ACTN|nr:hypothetical protein [Actinomadura rudentiformis]KAB2346383.1 hypothetical protein F8566_23205 [Actinomadura rudentiformis]